MITSPNARKPNTTAQTANSKYPKISLIADINVCEASHSPTQRSTSSRITITTQNHGVHMADMAKKNWKSVLCLCIITMANVVTDAIAATHHLIHAFMYSLGVCC